MDGEPKKRPKGAGTSLARGPTWAAVLVGASHAADEVLLPNRWAHALDLRAQHRDALRPGAVLRLRHQTGPSRLPGEACLAGIGEIDAWFSSREADLVATAGERLHALGDPYLLVDPRAPFLRPDAGQVLSDARMIPSEQFAAIVYLDDSPPMDAVYW